MSETQAIQLCMGSACHQLGGFRLIPILQALIREHHLQDRLELKGAFCLETCNLGRSMRFGDQVLTGLNENNIRQIFEREILPRFQPQPGTPAPPTPEPKAPPP